MMGIKRKAKGETMLANMRAKRILLIALLSVLPLIAFSVSVLGGSAKVPVSNFKILSFRAVWGEFGTLRVIGEVKNTGSIAAGVELEAIARDSNGNLVDVAKFWPNSVNNIPPGGSTGFKFPLTEDKSAKKVEVKVINAQVW